MPATLIRRRPRVHHGQIVDHAALNAEAVKALADASASRADAARALNVSPPAITHALGEEPPTAKYASIRRRIIEAFSPFRVEEDVLYRIVDTRKA